MDYSLGPPVVALENQAAPVQATNLTSDTPQPSSGGTTQPGFWVWHPHFPPLASLSVPNLPLEMPLAFSPLAQPLPLVLELIPAWPAPRTAAHCLLTLLKTHLLFWDLQPYGQKWQFWDECGCSGPSSILEHSALVQDQAETSPLSWGHLDLSSSVLLAYRTPLAEWRVHFYWEQICPGRHFPSCLSSEHTGLAWQRYFSDYWRSQHHWEEMSAGSHCCSS